MRAVKALLYSMKKEEKKKVVDLHMGQNNVGSTEQARLCATLLYLLF